MVECGRFPTVGGMAAFAGVALGTGMHVGLLVAAEAGFGCAFEYAVDMALGALNGGMLAS